MGYRQCALVCLWLPVCLSMEVKIAVILPFDDERMFSVRRIAPAINLAITEINEDKTLMKNHTFSVKYNDSKCDIAEGINKAITFYIRKEAHVFLGPVCDFAVAPVGRQVTFWNIPVISGGAMARDFSSYRSTQYQLLTRVGPVNSRSLSIFFATLITHYKWLKIKLLYSKEGQDYLIKGLCHLAIEALHYDLDALYPNITQDYFRLHSKTDMEKLLKEEIGLDYSVVVLCASPQAVREIMIKAHELNFDNGEYVFFNIDLFSSKNDSERPWYKEGDDEERNNKARIAYEALMTVTLRKPTSPEYKIFSTEVKRRAKQMYENFTYGEEEVNSFVGAFHDAVILYALALNETLAANISITNGSEITKRMWNRTFEGITGTVSIDQNGDRNADYSLLDLNPETDTFEVVANYYGNKKQYEPVEHKSIHWAGGRNSPPPDTPDCGFDGSKCPPDEPFPEYGIVIIVLGSIILIVLVAAFFIYRNKRNKTYQEVAKAFRISESSVKSKVRNMKVKYAREKIPESSRGLVHSAEDMPKTHETHCERISFRDVLSHETPVSDKACGSYNGEQNADVSGTVCNPLDKRDGPTMQEDETLNQAVNNGIDDTYGQYVNSAMREIHDADIKRMVIGQIDDILAKARRSPFREPTDAHYA